VVDVEVFHLISALELLHLLLFLFHHNMWAWSMCPLSELVCNCLELPPSPSLIK
jgi:hypothetical protein